MIIRKIICTVYVVCVAFKLCICSQHAIAEELLMINFEEALNNEHTILISELADSVEYIALQTPKDVIIHRIKKIAFYEDFLYLISGSICYLFSKDGRYIRTIGREGRGPGEYTIATSFEIDKKKREVIISGIPYVLLHYSLDGKYLYTSAKCIWTSWLAFSDTTLWCAVTPTPIDKNVAFAISYRHDTLACIPNLLYGMQSHNGKIQFLAAPNVGKPFYNYSGVLFFKDFGNCNDTIWKITGVNAAPYAYINMGKYKLPFEYKMEISNEAFKKYGENYCYVTLIGEDHTYLYYHVSNWIGNKNDCRIMFDKKTKTGFAVKYGFIDDIHKGANIYVSDISEDFYIGYIDAEELLDLKYDETILSLPYKRLLSNIKNENVTQLIILCHKKNEH